MTGETINYNWSFEKYIRLVEHTDNPMLKEYQQVELDYITSKIDSSYAKTFIDVGAGYGRVIPRLAGVAEAIIAVEINQNMLVELGRKSRQFHNVKALGGDASHLSELLKGERMKTPVILSLQNSLGTWQGDYKVALRQMKKVAQERNGEIVLSLFCQEGLKEFGVDMYEGLKELVGEVDLERTNFEKGIFVSKTNYLSHWWRPDERAEIAKMLDGQKVKEVLFPTFYILHIKYS